MGTLQLPPWCCSELTERTYFSLRAVNNHSLCFQLPLRWCMLFFYCGSIKPRAGCAPSARQRLCDPSGLGRTLQQKQEAVHGPGRDPSHESNGAHPDETRGRSGPINKVWKDIRREVCVSVCVSQRGAHLSSSSRVTLLHTGGKEELLTSSCSSFRGELL